MDSSQTLDSQDSGQGGGKASTTTRLMRRLSALREEGHAQTVQHRRRSDRRRRATLHDAPSGIARLRAWVNKSTPDLRS